MWISEYWGYLSRMGIPFIKFNEDIDIVRISV